MEEMSFKKIPRFFHNVIAEWQACAKISYDIRSQFRLSVDFVLSRLLFALPRNLINRMRQVRTRDGATICYRLNRGDLQSIREVWLEEAYRLPLPEPSGVLLDLGANIGLTSVWLAKRYRFSRIIAVEPVAENAVLVRRNLEINDKWNQRCSLGSRNWSSKRHGDVSSPQELQSGEVVR